MTECQGRTKQAKLAFQGNVILPQNLFPPAISVQINYPRSSLEGNEKYRTQPHPPAGGFGIQTTTFFYFFRPRSVIYDFTSTGWLRKGFEEFRGKPNLSEKISRSPDGLGLAEGEPSGRGKRNSDRWSRNILVFEGKFGLPKNPKKFWLRKKF